MNKEGSLIKGILLVAGTSIGGGMLALPILTGLAGFAPSILVYLLCWFFMTCTGLLLLEVCFWFDKEVNIVTMAEKTLGQTGKWAGWILYLFLFYCLTLAYIVGCGDLVVEVFQQSIPEWLGSLIFVLLFAPLIYVGARVVGRLNLILIAGLAISYFAFVWLGYSHVDVELWKRRDWSALPLAFPIAFVSFAYQGIVPTLVNYMHRDVKKIRLAIIFGTLIPLVVYIIWQGLILGIVPVEGADGLLDALNQGENAVYTLKNNLNSPGIYRIGQFFAFFALVTSFLGVTLGLLDFLADGLNIKKTPSGKFLLCALIIVPPFVISLLHPGLFLMALDFAGGFGCALLLGLLPILMVWSGRYNMGLKSPYMLTGGKGLLIALGLFVLFELVCQIKLLFNL